MAAQTRMTELKMNQGDVAAGGSLSPTTLRKILAWADREREPTPEELRGYQSSTWRKLATGLRWTPGSVQDVLAGGDPAPLETLAAELDGDGTDRQDDPYEIVYRGWRVTLKPRKGATPQQIAAAERDVLENAWAALRALENDPAPESEAGSDR